MGASTFTWLISFITAIILSLGIGLDVTTGNLDISPFNKVIFPEKESGIRLAKNLLSAGFSGMIELSDDVSMVEIDVKDEWVGKTLIDLSLRNKYSINVVAIRMDNKINTAIDPNLPLEKGMQLIVIANKLKLQKLK